MAAVINDTRSSNEKSDKCRDCPDEKDDIHGIITSCKRREPHTSAIFLEGSCTGFYYVVR